MGFTYIYYIASMHLLRHDNHLRGTPTDRKTVLFVSTLSLIISYMESKIQASIGIGAYTPSLVEKYPRQILFRQEEF